MTDRPFKQTNKQTNRDTCFNFLTVEASKLKKTFQSNSFNLGQTWLKN